MKHSIRSLNARNVSSGWHALPLAALPLLAVAGSSSQALAHTAGGDGGLASGLLHPVSGLDHVLAMVLVGIWGAQLGRPAVWVLPIAFPTVMAVGGFIGLIGIELPGAEIAIALSVVALGTMVAFSFRPVLALAFAMIGGFALFHGHAHGAELPPDANSQLYSMGFVMATGCLHGVGISIGLANRLRGGELLLRGLGAAAGLAGIYILSGIAV